MKGSDLREVLVQYRLIVLLLVVAALLRLGWIDNAFVDQAIDGSVRLIEAAKKALPGG